MQNIRFKAIVKKGNDRGVGFISIPIDRRSSFEKNLQIKAILNLSVEVYAKIRFYGTLGFYIPYKIMHQNKLKGFINVEIKKIDGFYTSVGSDGRIYIPEKEAEKLFLENNDILEIKGNVKGIEQTRYPMLNVRKKSNNSIDYMCSFDSKLSGNFGIFSIVRKLKKDTIIESALQELYCGIIDDETTILYYGNHQPVIINKNIKFDILSHYLGCYFSDGTKRGNNWGICASTFEQANYYYLMHHHLIKDSKIVSNISFTDTDNINVEELIKYLNEAWRNNVKYLSGDVKVRVIKSECKFSLKTNKFGSLVMKENRKLTQIYYNHLLELLFDEMISSKELAINFICGVLEGDGSVSPHLGHLVIATNNRELSLLKEALEHSDIKYNVRIEGENKSCIHIGLLEVIRNIGLLKDKIFIYYPKRRKLLKERLLNTASVRFLLGKSSKTSNWLIGQFNKMGILDGKGHLTEFGIEIQEDLREFLSE